MMIFQKSQRYTSVFTGILCSVVMVGYAQEKEQQQQQEPPATIDSIDVVRDYRPVLADAVKIRQSPNMTNKRRYQPEFTYGIIDKKLDINTGTKQLTIQEMPFSSGQTLTNNYAKIGAGNLGTLLGEVRSEEHTSELQSRENLVCRLLLEKKKLLLKIYS